MYEYEKLYKCRNKDFTAFKSKGEHTFTDDEIKALCDKKRLEGIKFVITNKDGGREEKVLDVELTKTPKNEKSDNTVLKNPNAVAREYAEIAKCPLCGGKVYRAEKVYRCVKGDFRVLLNKSGHEFTEGEVKELCGKKKM